VSDFWAIRYRFASFKLRRSRCRHYWMTTRRLLRDSLEGILITLMNFPIFSLVIRFLLPYCNYYPTTLSIGCRYLLTSWVTIHVSPICLAVPP
jgi:hypothetical protein